MCIRDSRDRQTDRQTETDRQTDRQRQRQRQRQRDRGTERDRDRNRNRETETEKLDGAVQRKDTKDASTHHHGRRAKNLTCGAIGK